MVAQRYLTESRFDTDFSDFEVNIFSHLSMLSLVINREHCEKQIIIEGNYGYLQYINAERCFHRLSYIFLMTLGIAIVTLIIYLLYSGFTVFLYFAKIETKTLVKSH